MQRIFQAHTTMWTEGVWEIVGARQSATKFIVSDNPVTFFNAKAFQGRPIAGIPLMFHWAMSVRGQYSRWAEMLAY